MFFPATHGDIVELDPVETNFIPRLAGSRKHTGNKSSNTVSRASSRLNTDESE
jgi:hypothetical protein